MVDIAEGVFVVDKVVVGFTLIPRIISPIIPIIAAAKTNVAKHHKNILSLRL